MSRRFKKKRRPGYSGPFTAGAIIVILISAAAVPFFWTDHFKSAVYYDKIVKYGTEDGVDPLFVLAVIVVESRFRPEAVSRAGAVGLMQIMPATGELLADEIVIEGYTEDGLKDPDTNIRLGTYYIGKLQRKYKNDILALAAYNAGEGRIDSYLGKKEMVSGDFLPSDLPWPETKRYVRSVLLIYSFLRVFAPIYGFDEI